MIENVTIVDKNGNGILAEGLMYIHVKSTDIRYVFYTLNEIANGNRVKIYIAETADEVGKASPIDEDEWEYLKKTIISVAHKEEMPDIEHIKMTGVTFNISEPKKLAIEMPVREALKEAQFARAISPEAQEGETLLFDSSSLNEKEAEVPAVEDNQVNIFNNPPTPVEVAPVPDTPAPEAPVEVQITPSSSLMEQGNLAGNSLIGDSLNVSPLVEEPSLGVPANNQNIAESVLVEEPTLMPPEMVKEETNIQEPASEIITQEEAIRCLETVLKYIKQNKELGQATTNISSVEKVEETTDIIETPLPVEEPVESSQTESVEVAMPQESEQPIEETPVTSQDIAVVENSPIMETTNILNIAPGLEEAIIQSHNVTPMSDPMGSLVSSSPESTMVEQTVNSVDNAINDMANLGMETPSAPATPEPMPAAIPEIADVVIQNPMSFEATGTNVNNSVGMIDTSLQGLQQEVHNSGFENPINPGLIPVSFDNPSIAPQTNNVGVMQPSSPAPVDNYIPDVTPTPPSVEEYVHQAVNNNGKVTIEPETIVSAPGLDVVMPDNAVNVQMVTEGMHGQGTLGPSGLNASAPNVLNLMN